MHAYIHAGSQADIQTPITTYIHKHIHAYIYIQVAGPALWQRDIQTGIHIHRAYSQTDRLANIRT